MKSSGLATHGVWQARSTAGGIPAGPIPPAVGEAHHSQLAPGTRPGHLPVDLVRSSVTVPDVLGAAGFDAPRRGHRMRCPLHGGDNSTAFSISTDGQRWHCFACNLGGDVFNLGMRLHNVGFRDAVAIVARIAGIDLATAPRLDHAAIEQRATIARRRRRLHELRSERLTALTVELRALDRDADAALAAMALPELVAIDHERAARELERQLLELEDENVWLDMLDAGEASWAA